MTASRHEVRMAVSALVALTLVRCSDEAGPTGWIPQNGTISGVITVTGAFPLPPAGAVRSSVGETALVFPAPARINTVAPRVLASRRKAWLVRGSRVAATPNELIVTFRHTALRAPRVGSAALATAAGVRAFGGAIRARL